MAKWELDEGWHSTEKFTWQVVTCHRQAWQHAHPHRHTHPPMHAYMYESSRKERMETVTRSFPLAQERGPAERMEESHFSHNGA